MSTDMLKNAKIGFIGCGSMGGALLRAMVKKLPADHICVSAAHFEHAKALADETGCTACKTNTETASECRYLFIAVKPAYIKEVLTEIKQELTEKKSTVISMAAGISLEKLSEMAGKTVPVIRIMPNMPAAVGEAMTALCCADTVPQEVIETVTALLECAGKAEKVPEKLMDCVTAVSGSGPAYVFMFIEALADAAVRFGMPRKQAYVYAAQTVKGSAAMVLEDGRCPGALKDAVCSPAGTTIEGVAVLEKDGFRNAVIEAASAACAKSAGMAK